MIGPDATAWSVAEYSRFNQLAVMSDPLTLATMKTVVMRSLWSDPQGTLAGIPRHIKSMGFAEQVGPEAMVIDEYTEGTVFDLPFFIFQGDQDAITPPEPARRFYESVTAPHKEFALIADASHFAAYRRPEQFLDLLLTKVLPAVEPARQQH